MNKIILKIFFTIGLGMVILNCGGTGSSSDEDEDEGDADGLTATLSSIQENIFTPECAGCHVEGGIGYAETEPTPLDLSSSDASFNSLVGIESVQERCGESQDIACGSRVTAGDSTESYLMNKLENDGVSFATDSMPQGGDLLEEEELEAIREWIENGAENN